MTTRYNACVVAAILLAVSTAQADTIYVDADCSSDCCSVHGTPGCDDPSCEAVVCDAFPPCCDVEWDAACVTVATALCYPECTGGDGTEGFPFCSIQTAIDNAVDTDEIIVAQGEYFENIDFSGKAIVVRSTDPNDAGVVLNTIINGGGSGIVVTCRSGEGAGTVLSGFVITGGDGSDGGGMANLSTSPTVTHCTFTGNSASSGGGMYNFGGSPTVNDCTFSGNTASSGGGMYNFGGSPTVNGCTFNGNSAQFGGGLFVSSGVDAVTTSIFTSNTAASGGGIFVSQGDLFIGGSEFCDNTATHITGSWTDQGNNSFCPLCDDASGDVLEVPAAYPTIQSAINAACDGAEVIVAPGAYYETITFGGKAITVRSTDPMDPVVVANTVIDGTGNRHVVQCVSGEGPDTVIDGFTITGGNATGPSPDNFGGGMYNDSSSPTVTNCTFSGNTADYGGGIYNDNSSPTVTNCTFSGNIAGEGGGMFNFNSSPSVIDCTFTDNGASSGGGMSNDNSDPTVANCRFIGNAGSNNGGGMRNADNSCPIVINCTFSGNHCSHWGGGMSNGTFSTPTIVNCTFDGNDAGLSGGAMRNYVGSSPTVTNSILWSNTPNQISGSATVQYSDVQGGWHGTGNIDTGPLFVDPDNGNYRLSAGSPCIDAGDNTAVPKGVLRDLDGNPRFVADACAGDSGATVDMGAYEFQGTSCDLGTMLEMLATWGRCNDCDKCRYDFDGDCSVGILDLLILLGNWTA